MDNNTSGKQDQLQVANFVKNWRHAINVKERQIFKKPEMHQDSHIDRSEVSGGIQRTKGGIWGTHLWPA
jgi:hypothetical protein